MSKTSFISCATSAPNRDGRLSASSLTTLAGSAATVNSSWACSRLLPEGEFDTVLFWSLDRFSREGVYETLQHLQRLAGFGVGYRSFTEQYLDSCGLFKDAVISILATIAKQERIRISERVAAGLQRVRQQGRVGGRPRVIADRDKVNALRASGVSLGQIAVEMDLSKTTVARMVSNEV